jgi:hypothetical protein
MTAYTDPATMSTISGAPATEALMTAMKNNPVAITEGSSGAPKIEDAALSTTVTAAGQSWVAARTTTPAVGAIGSYAMLAYTGTDTTISPGETKSADLFYAGIDDVGTVSVSASGPDGTWKAMGYVQGSAPPLVTMWLRTA